MEMEVICISSDESDSQKENKTDKFVTNSTETCIGGIAHGKETISDNEKVEENNLKRKKLHTDKEVIQSMEKRKRLNSDQGTFKVTNESIADLCSVYTPEVCLIKSDYNAQSNKNQKTTIEKTQLIMKEKKKISYISQDVFPLFISLCLQKCPKQEKEDMDKIIVKLKRYYENMDPIYARSEDFVLFLNQKREAIMNNKKKMYVYMEDVKNEMKKKVRKRQALQNNDIYDAVPSTSYTANNLSVNNGVELNNDDDANENDDNDDNNIEDNDNEENASLKREQQISTKRKIKQVLLTMKKCEANIRRLDEKEVDFDDEDESNYIKVERYKRRMTELYNKLCELTGENIDAGRVYLHPKHFNVTRIVAVDQAITNFINSKIIRRNKMKKTDVLTDNLIFPDYRDILECVNRCNDRKNLGLDKKRCEQMAEKAFKELGEHLQRTRRNDYWDTFSLYLENTEDPAIKDESLARKLADNRIEGDKRLTAVFEKYAKKQEEIKDQSDEETSGEEEDEEEESIIDDKDKSDENLSVTSEKDSDNEDDIDKTIKENRLSMEKNKPNISMVNISMDTKVILNKPAAGALQGKCNEIIKIKVWKKSDTVVSKNENKTINEKIIYKPCTNNTILKNVLKNITVTETQEDSPDSTANCTKDLAEVKTIEVSKVITDPATKKKTKVVADTITGVATELITRDIAEPRTEDAAELITEDVTETITENIAKIITDKTENMVDETMENMPNNEQPEEEKKPVLRLRSFAKPPTTWKDSQHKMDKTIQKKVIMSKVVNQEIKEIVDLTNEGTAKPAPVITKCAVQLRDKVVPILKHQLVIPANRNIISVQNITNNYLKVNTRTGQIIAPVRDICKGSTVIRLPIQSTNQQNQPQNVNDVALKNEIPLKRNETILKRILIPKKSFIISKKSTVQSVSKQTDVSSSTTNSK